MRAESRMKKLKVGKWLREDGGRWRTLGNRTLRGVNMKAMLYIHDQYPFATLSLSYA